MCMDFERNSSALRWDRMDCDHQPEETANGHDTDTSDEGGSGFRGIRRTHSAQQNLNRVSK